MAIYAGQKLISAAEKGQFPLRRALTQSLIVILLFLSPLTFSTDTVPNFQPDCETHVALKEKSRIAFAVIRNMAAGKILSIETPSPSHFILAVLFLPSSTPLLSSPSRAPPA